MDTGAKRNCVNEVFAKRHGFVLGGVTGYVASALPGRLFDLALVASYPCCDALSKALCAVGYCGMYTRVPMVHVVSPQAFAKSRKTCAPCFAIPLNG